MLSNIYVCDNTNASILVRVCVYSDAASPEEEAKADGPEGVEEE